MAFVIRGRGGELKELGLQVGACRRRIGRSTGLQAPNQHRVSNGTKSKHAACLNGALMGLNNGADVDNGADRRGVRSCRTHRQTC